ncbi:MAG: tRNA (N6-isopentenyl adenosine(37)-C2)-methylthiotransferase MiaB, partial [Cyclobacteriaceae bacterium]
MKELVEDIGILDEAHQPCEVVKTTENSHTGQKRKLYIESYGCQMNFSDSEIVASILQKTGFDTTSRAEEADVIFLNTCSIREKAEQTVRNRLTQLNGLKKQKPELTV